MVDEGCSCCDGDAVTFAEFDAEDGRCRPPGLDKVRHRVMPRVKAGLSQQTSNRPIPNMVEIDPLRKSSITSCNS
jgi:hypothetical protein